MRKDAVCFKMEAVKAAYHRADCVSCSVMTCFVRTTLLSSVMVNTGDASADSATKRTVLRANDGHECVPGWGSGRGHHLLLFDVYPHQRRWKHTSFSKPKVWLHQRGREWFQSSSCDNMALGAPSCTSRSNLLHARMSRNSTMLGSSAPPQIYAVAPQHEVAAFGKKTALCQMAWVEAATQIVLLTSSIGIFRGNPHLVALTCPHFFPRCCVARPQILRPKHQNRRRRQL